MALQDFINGYLTCAIWSSNNWDNVVGDNPEPLDKTHSIEDIAPQTLAGLTAECQTFYEANNHLWHDLKRGEWSADELAGHDFWLTRNGHGTGFWDRGIEHGKELTKLCKAYKEIDLYVGDDNQIYAGGFE